MGESPVPYFFFKENIMKNKTLSAYIVIFFYAAFVGFSFFFVKSSAGIASPLQTMTFRFIAGLLPSLVLLAIGKLKISVKGKPKLSLLLMAVTYVGFLGFQAFGLVYTTSIVSGILFAIVPIFARLIAGIVLKERTTWLQNIFMLCSVGAVIALFAVGSIDELGSIDRRGFILLLCSSLSCAVSNVLMRYVKKSYSPLQISCFNCLAGVAIFGIWSVISCTANGTWGTYFAPLTNSSYLTGILYLGLCCTFITGILISYSLRYLPAVNTTIWGNFSTAISVVAGALLLKEALLPYQIVCTILIIIGVMGISFFTKPPKRRLKR